MCLGRTGKTFNWTGLGQNNKKRKSIYQSENNNINLCFFYSFIVVWKIIIIINNCIKLSGRWVCECPGAGAFTVISQPTDSKMLPRLAIPATQPWAPTQGQSRHPSHCDNHGGKRPELHKLQSSLWNHSCINPSLHTFHQFCH